jgi:DNA-nicking Smr family endonuclease
MMSSNKKNRSEAGDSSLSDSPFGEPVVIPIQDFIDLHSFLPKEIPSVVAEYLEQCLQAGFSEVRIVHGRGAGVQRKIVRSILEKHPAVLSFQDAPPDAGGWGATVILLKIPST